VVLNGRDEARLERAAAELGAEDRVATVAGSIGERATARRLALVAHERFGGVDVLVNNAGIFGVKPFLESSEEDLDRFYATNVKGTWLVTQAVVPALIEAGGGAIINVGTVLVSQGMAELPVSARARPHRHPGPPSWPATAFASTPWRPASSARP